MTNNLNKPTGTSRRFSTTGPSSERLAVDAVEGWMNSPGHQANILRKDYLRDGIGIAIDKNEKISNTQDFW